jgi:hypothetical protein
MLVDKLHKYGITGTFLVYKLFGWKNKICVKIACTLSDPMKVTCDVTQRSVLGPIYSIHTLNQWIAGNSCSTLY